MSRSICHSDTIIDVYLLTILCRFLLVSLNIDAILGEVTIRHRRKKLEEMARGNGLSEAYTATISRLKAQKGYKSVLGLKVLMWVSYSERPLRGEELCHALGVEIGSADPDPESVPALRTLVASCLGLVTVEASSSTVRLVHFTLQEHLSSDPTLFHSPHSAIAEVCLTYLNFGSVRCLSPTRYSVLVTTPLLQYASVHWGEHAKRGMTEHIKILALRLLDGFDQHISAHLVLLHSRGEIYYRGVVGPIGFTGLHGVAFLGIVDIAAAVLDMKKWDINAPDCTGSTALAWAARRNQLEIVKMFLERGDVNPNQTITNFQTLFMWAAENWHEEVVEMLLKREDTNPNQSGTEYGQTPLLWAAENGQEKLIKMLLKREDVNPNKADTQYGRPPLSWAARNGNSGAVKMLLERGDINPDQADTEYGRKPLSWAVGNGHWGVVKMLLQRWDVNPDQTDTRYGRTPLSLAAECGQEEIVKMLLERGDVTPDQADTICGWTPLSWASRNGHSGIVKILFERGDVNPDQADTKYGRTPLSLAAENGQDEVVKMLLQRGDVNPDKSDTKYGRTPLWWAVENGQEEVVKVLLKWKDVHNATLDNKNKIPLSLALSDGHYGAVMVPLERRNKNYTTTDLHARRTFTPSTVHPDGAVVGMESISPGSDTGITGSNGHHLVLSASRRQRLRLLDQGDSLSRSANRRRSACCLGSLPVFPPNSSTAEEH